MGDRLTWDESQAEPKTYGDIFDELFPHYLVMGMTPEQYWDGESWLKKSYRKAYQIRMENEGRIRDQTAWLHGVYMTRALKATALLVNGFVPKGAKPEPYPDKPQSEEERNQRKKETQNQREENKMQLQMAMFQAMAERFNRNFQKRKEQESRKAVKT